MSVSVLRRDLSNDDVIRLMRSRNLEERAAAAHKICRRIDDSDLSQADRIAAEQVLKIMANDAAKQVRLAVSITLRNSLNVPPEVARRLANDLDEIASPFLEFSPVLTDEDLLDIVRAANNAKMRAIAGRERVPNDVCDEIVRRAESDSVARLARNDGAELEEAQFDVMVDRFGRDETVTGAMLDRSELPVTITERLVSLVSDQLLEKLATRHALPPALAVELAEGARERATIDILDQAAHGRDHHRLVQQLQLAGRLTPSLVMRAAAMGHMGFFEHAMAELAGLPHNKAWILLHDGGPLGLRAIFDRTGIPSRHFPAMRAAMDIYHEFVADGLPTSGDAFARAMIERVLTRHQGMAEEDISYLMEKLDAYSRDLADIRAA
jgi:uncharacterized protein (DUF2336 family)